jgi:putative phosphoesterase
MKIGIISDAHGNVHAFNRGINLLTKLGADEIIFLGDAIGYIPSVKVLQSLMALENLKICLRGNHEDMLINDLYSIKNDEVYQISRTKSLLTEKMVRFISEWPSTFNINLSIGSALFVHGSPSDPIYGYVYPDTNLSSYAPNADYVFMGNSHYPFIRQNNNTTYVNVGSCGLPRDNGKYGAMGLFDSESGRIQILRFPIESGTSKTLSEVTDVHPSVKLVFDRKKLTMVGDIYE